MDYISIKDSKLFAGNTPFLMRGFGLGGWLLPEGYMWKLYTKCDRQRRMEAMIAKSCGEEYEKQFWRRYYDSYITQWDIQFIAEQGFNSVRLPLNARHLFEVKENKVSFNEEILYYVDQCIQWCKEEGIYVILDMHAAFGGQTGQNIDDSEDDKPRLFIDVYNQELLIQAWELLACRYKDEPVVAGYDLLNEPLPKWQSQYNEMLLPLYRRMIQAIRNIDDKHIIILEGLHWATDFSVFEDFPKEEAEDTIMLQFHKYWSAPDAQSIKGYIDIAKELNVPLFMGEGGENNCEWYTTVFPMYEREDISWSFWTYKKMDCTNSPVTFRVPENWDWIIQWIEGERQISKEEAILIFDDFIKALQDTSINQPVINALQRRVPIQLPSEAYDFCEIKSERLIGADIRLSEPVTILFQNGRVGEVNYQRYGGESQPETENLVVKLKEGDMVGYYFFTMDKNFITDILLEGQGEVEIACSDEVVQISVNGCENIQLPFIGIVNERNQLCIKCISGSIYLDTINLKYNK